MTAEAITLIGGMLPPACRSCVARITQGNTQYCDESRFHLNKNQYSARPTQCPKNSKNSLSRSNIHKASPELLLRKLLRK